MSEFGYVVWFILMAIAIALVIAVGCLGALGFFSPEERHARADARRRRRRSREPTKRKRHRHLRHARDLLVGPHS